MLLRDLQRRRGKSVASLADRAFGNRHSPQTRSQPFRVVDTGEIALGLERLLEERFRFVRRAIEIAARRSH